MTSAGVEPPGRAARTRGAADAESEIERDYARLETEVLGTVRAKLAASGAPVDHDGLGAAYNQAWHALYAARVAGDEIENRTGFLVQVTYRRALDERRAARRELALDPLDDEIGVERDLAGEIDDRIQVRALMQGMRERLDARELHAATLCYVHGYTRPEAASALGVRPRRFEKVMDRVSKELTGLVGDLRAGEWCESRRSLIGAYALGVLDTDGERHRLATAHLEDCPACRRRVACMRGLAAVAPPVPLLLGTAASGGGAAAGSALADRWEWLARLQGHGAEVVAGGAAVAAATSALVVFGPPADWGSSSGGGAAEPAARAAPLVAGASAAPRAAATGSAARARAEARRRERQRRRERRAADPAPAATPAAPAEVAPVAPEPVTPTPAPSAPATPSPPAAAPADDGWEEFELQR